MKYITTAFITIIILVTINFFSYKTTETILEQSINDCNEKIIKLFDEYLKGEGMAMVN